MKRAHHLRRACRITPTALASLVTGGDTPAVCPSFRTGQASGLKLTATLLIGLGCVACGGDNEPFRLTSFHRVGQERGPAGSSCLPLGESFSGRRGDREAPFWTRENTRGDVYEITLGSFEHTLEIRHYNTSFFEAHRTDRFVVTTPNDGQHAFMIWGASSCADCPDLDYERLPGDPSRCGSPPATDASEEPDAEAPGEPPGL